MTLDRIQTLAALNSFIDYVTSQAKANLTRGDSNVSRRLYNSIKGDAKAFPNSIQVDIFMEDYGEFQDKGVKGAVSSALAPNSPYKFGTGTGRKGGLTDGIQEWVRRRRIQFKDTRSGKFYSYDQTARLIIRSVYNKGMRPKMFFTKPFEAGFQRLPDEVVEAYGLDLENMLKLILDNGTRDRNNT